jgi:hypothetical protein
MTGQPMDFIEDRDAKIARRIEDQARAIAEAQPPRPATSKRLSTG